MRTLRNRIGRRVAGVCLPLVLGLQGALSVAPPANAQDAYDRPSVRSVVQGARISLAQRMALKPKYRIVKPRRVEFDGGVDRRRIIVKFHDGTRVRAANPRDLDVASSNDRILMARLETLAPVLRRLNAYDNSLLRRHRIDREQLVEEMEDFRDIVGRPSLDRWGRVFQQSAASLERLRRNTERRTERQASDMANYYWFEFEKGTPSEVIATRLNQLRIVEEAYLAPIPEDADFAPTTPNFQVASGNPSGFSQGYLNAAPGGIDANFAQTVNGGTGTGITVIDIETGWVLGHEDLPNMAYEDGRVNSGDGNHGTAVMSVMVGTNDNAGVLGIAFGANGGVGSVRRNYGATYFTNVGDAIIEAAWSLSAGDVIVIEQHAQFLMGEDNCVACETSTGAPSGQCGYVAMEYWSHIFDAVVAASASGIIVVEAAGNGQQNLDNDRYDNRFDRTWRNSGAIFVGAGRSGTPHTPMCFSNFGSRLDLQGWGQNVMAAGYGESGGQVSAALRANGGDNRQWYRNDFSGTSSASPIVAGAVLAVQGVQRANGHPPLNWLEVRRLLEDTGTPQGAGVRIGPLPDLQAALTRLASDFPPLEPGTDGEIPTYTYELTLAPNVQPSATVAGVSGSQTRVLDAQAFFQLPGFPTLPTPTDLGLRAIEGLTMAEKNDKPCYARIGRVNVFDNEARGQGTVNICRNSDPTNRSMKSVLPSPAHNLFVHAVDVCMTSNGNHPARLKGVRLHRSRMSDNGTLTPVLGPGPNETIERPNCNGNWTQAICPENAVATQLILHTRPDDRNTDRAERSFSGIALGCKEVIATPICQSGCN